MPNKYDFTIFATMYDKDIAKIYGVSRSRIAYIRSQRGIPPFTAVDREQQKKEKIVKYLKRNKNSLLFLGKLKKTLHIRVLYKKEINTKTIQAIAKENNIVINFRVRREILHGRRAYINKKCKCDICKLANTITMYFFYRKTTLKTRFIDEFANEYIKFYKKDKSIRHENFWCMLTTKCKQYMFTRR